MRHIARGCLRLLMLALVVGALFHLTRLPFFTISSVSVEGGETVSHEAVREKVRAVLNGTYLLIVPRSFAYLYPHDEIIRSIESMPRVKEISLVRLDRTLLAVTFKEHMPHALWCTEGTETCWFMDEEGYAFTEAPMIAGGVLVRHYGAEEIREGQVLDAAALASIDTFIQEVHRLGFRVASVHYRSTGDVDFSLHRGGTIRTSGKDFDLALENVRAIVLSPEFKHLRPGNFGYIDVRFDGKAFVNESIAPQATTTPTTTDSL